MGVYTNSILSFIAGHPKHNPALVSQQAQFVKIQENKQA